MYFCLFSDKRLILKGFSRSESLPYPQNYRTVGNNPILMCLVDQMKPNQELSKKYPNQAALLDHIIAALETEKINWPSAFNLMSSEEWIRKMRTDPKFYWHCAKNSSEMQEYENLLLDLAAQCFKRKIQLIPFLEQDDGLTFKPTKTWFSRLKKIFVTDKPTFHLMSNQNLHRDNFFISITKNL